ncbi:MAG: transcriptional regulator [Phycisphaerales bacterium]|nr:transcriptional regulator [Phycisphaerales bacterium]
MAKILSTLSRAGIVSGTRGPGGGYTLARPPKAIALRDSLVGIQANMDVFLSETTLERFRVAYQELCHRPVPTGTKPKPATKRESYRAPKKGK